jgi:Fic family protein
MLLNDYQATEFGAPRRTLGRLGYVAYFPAPIPRRIDLSPGTIALLADAEAALGRLSGVGQLLSNPMLLVRPYQLREALASTRIEGTQASMMDILESEASGDPASPDVEEVLNYVSALTWGLDQVEQIPLSVRLIRAMHARLMAGVRGRERSPGEIRTSQNWVGGGGSTIETTRFVPPPPEELPSLLADWERFAHDSTLTMPVLVQNALLHYQFETLHPFLDGNGRLGRLLIVFSLVQCGRLSAPLLYLSSSLEKDRDRYYESLQAVRERGDIGPWLTLFLEAVQTQSTDAIGRAQKIVALREEYRADAAKLGSSNGALLVDFLFESPVVSSIAVERRLAVTRPTALKLLRQAEQLGILRAIEPGPRKQQRYIAHAIVSVVTAVDPAPAPRETPHDP